AHGSATRCRRISPKSCPPEAAKTHPRAATDPRPAERPERPPGRNSHLGRAGPPLDSVRRPSQHFAPAMHRPPRAWACAPLRLESRLAPAALMTYTDVDGDLVNVSTSKGSAAALAVALTFNDPNPQHARQLQLVNFAANPGPFA